MKIVNLVNCYNNEKEIFQYASMIKRLDGSNELLLVININSLLEYKEREFIKEIKERFNNALVFNSGINLGYLNGMLHGYNELLKLKNFNNYEYIIMSNTDIFIKDIQFLRKLMSNEYPENIGCVAPCVMTPTRGTYENPQYIERLSKQSMKRRILIFSLPPMAVIYFKLANLKSRLLKREKPSSGYMYSAHGCYFILTKKFMDIFRKSKYGATMYSEEIYIAEKILQANFEEYYDEALEVEHLESTVTSLLANKKKCKMISDSLKYVYQEYFEN